MLNIYILAIAKRLFYLKSMHFNFLGPRTLPYWINALQRDISSYFIKQTSHFSVNPHTLEKHCTLESLKYIVLFVLFQMPKIPTDLITLCFSKRSERFLLYSSTVYRSTNSDATIKWVLCLLQDFVIWW